MKLYAVKLPNCSIVELYNKVLVHIDDKKREQIERYLNPKDSLRSLISYVLVRVILHKRINKNIKDIIIDYNEYGKPYILNNNDIEFNVSHSEDWVVMAIDEFTVGIDVEKIKNINYLNIANRFFSNDENKELNNQEEKKQLDYFYDLWTLNESYIKAEGGGLSIPLNSFSIIKHDNTIILKEQEDKKKYYFKQYNIENGYSLSVCSVKNNFCEKFDIIDYNKLFNEYLSIN